jgi:minor histocompatibility antigen H13
MLGLVLLTFAASLVELPYELNLLFFSLAIIYIGSVKSLDQYSLKRDSNFEGSNGLMARLLSTTQMVWLFPILSSIFLMIAYIVIKSNFNKSMMNLLMFFIGWTGTMNLSSYLKVVALKFGGENIEIPVPFLKNIQSRFFTFRLTFLNLLCIVVAGYVTFLYLKTKNWMFNNILAISFWVYFLNKLLVTNFRNAIIYLSGMLLYDIFWVFGSDVMVTVATQLDLPIKLMFPRDPNSSKTTFYMMGIGDIALPGIFWAMMLRYDFLRAVTQTRQSFTIENFDSLKESLNFNKPYFYSSLIGYAVGLLVTTSIYRLFNSAQPALLYINPLMLGTTMVMAAVWGKFRKLFNFDEDRFIEEHQRES